MPSTTSCSVPECGRSSRTIGRAWRNSGEFASEDWAGTRAVVHASIAFMRQSGLEFFFAFAPPGVYLHMRDELGIPLSSIDVPVNRLVVQTTRPGMCHPPSTSCATDPPHVVVGIVPFFDVADTKLAVESGTSPLSFLV